MSEDKIGQNIIPWKNEASEEAMLAVARVGEDAIHSASAGMKEAGNEQREFVHDAAGRFEEAGRALAQSAGEKMHTMIMFPGSEGLQDMQASMTGLIEGVVRTNLRLAQEIFMVQSPRAFLELQQRFMQEYFQAFQQGTEALIRAAKGASPLAPII